MPTTGLAGPETLGTRSGAPAGATAIVVLLLAVLVSPATVVTDALTFTAPGCVGVTLIGNETVPVVAVSAATLQVTTCPAAVQPAGRVAVSMVMPAGMLMVAVVAAALVAPSLATVSV